MELLANRIGGEAPAIDTPDRPARQPGIAGAELLAQVLDQIDYGLLLVGSTGALRYANHLAMEALSARGALLLQQRMLRARAGDDQVLLADALADAQHGRRRLITLGKASTEVSLALVPMPAPVPGGGGGDEPLCLLLLGKQQACESLSIDFFSRAHGLTGAETEVLRGLCRGRKPKELARQLGVAISTVRTQIGSVRTKTKSGSIGDLMRRVAVLPPIARAVKGGGPR